MNEAEKERLKEIFRSSKGIVDHEFSQEVIDARTYALLFIDSLW